MNFKVGDYVVWNEPDRAGQRKGQVYQVDAVKTGTSGKLLVHLVGQADWCLWYTYRFVPGWSPEESIYG